MSHASQHVCHALDRARDLRIDRNAHERVCRPADSQRGRASTGQRGVRLRRPRDQKRIADLRHREAVEHGRRVAHAFGLHEVLTEAVSVLVLQRTERDPPARGLQAHAPAEARWNADRSCDVGSMRDWHHAGDDGRHPAAGRSAG